MPKNKIIALVSVAAIAAILVTVSTVWAQTEGEMETAVPQPQATEPLEITIVAPTTPNLIQNQAVDFSASATGGTAPYVYGWDFGDGNQAAGQSFAKTFTSAGTFTVTAMVTDFEGHQKQTSRQFTVASAEPQTPAPTVDLKANNQDGTLTVSSSTAVTLTWATQNATSCVASGAWSGAKLLGSSEALTSLAVGQSYTYTLTCTGQGGTASDSVTVVVQSDGGGNPVAPTVDLKANGQDGSLTVMASSTITLSWTSANATSCTASNAWSGTKATSGSETVVASSTEGVSATYTLTCTAAGGSASDSVTISTQVSGGSTGHLEVYDITVTDVTQTSAIVHWKTRDSLTHADRAATSRVIYDTVSHPSISGQASPNYGYSVSTATFDVSPKVVQHAVTISGLAPNTQYYFRVISED